MMDFIDITKKYNDTFLKMAQKNKVDFQQIKEIEKEEGVTIDMISFYPDNKNLAGAVYYEMEAMEQTVDPSKPPVKAHRSLYATNIERETVGRTFKKELTGLINKYSIENCNNTPDFILAEFVMSCLRGFTESMKERDKWWGIEIDDAMGIKIKNK